MSEIRVGPTWLTCDECAETNDGYGEITHDADCSRRKPTPDIARPAEWLHHLENLLNIGGGTLGRDTTRDLIALARKGVEDAERLDALEDEIRRTMAALPPFYAYGDNEAACWMGDKLALIASHFTEERNTRSGRRAPDGGNDAP